MKRGHVCVNDLGPFEVGLVTEPHYAVFGHLLEPRLVIDERSERD